MFILKKILIFSVKNVSLLNFCVFKKITLTRALRILITKILYLFIVV